MNARAKWSIGAAATLACYLTGSALGHVLAWGAARIDERLAKITDLGGSD